MRAVFLFLTLLPQFVRSQSFIDSSQFVKVKAGTYTLGKKGHAMNPLHKATVAAFYISKYEVTNAQFEQFATATGYITIAEMAHNALVYAPPLDEFQWKEDSTAYWRCPNGISRGGIAQKMNHPVTCIAFKDIEAYCKWAGVRLPTLDEWEIASRAGSNTDYFFGSTATGIDRYSNIWHGRNHQQADSSDGFVYTSPVGQFAPNAWGLYDMYGNVFEYCSDRKPSLKNKIHLAQARGGSWWCSKKSCGFFNSVDCGRNDKMASFSNQGFRVVLRLQ
jgi:formylglycine-generating enzyme